MITLTVITDGSTIDIDPNDIDTITRHPTRLSGSVVEVYDKFVEGPYGYHVAEDLLTICTLVALHRADRPADKEEGCTDLGHADEDIAAATDALQAVVAGMSARNLAAALTILTLHPDGTIVIER